MTTDARTLSETVYARLAADIIGGRLAAGSKLRLEALCERYAIGMSPLREALARLVGRGLVVQAGQRGFSVAPASATDLADVTETRVRLECMALDLAIANGDDAWEAEILAAHHRLSCRRRTAEVLVDETWERLHREFHVALIRASGSPWLLSFCVALHDQFDRYRRAGVQRAGDHLLLADDHAPLVDSVLARDAAAAREHMERHIRISAAAVKRQMALEETV